MWWVRNDELLSVEFLVQPHVVCCCDWISATGCLYWYLSYWFRTIICVAHKTLSCRNTQRSRWLQHLLMRTIRWGLSFLSVTSGISSVSRQRSPTPSHVKGYSELRWSSVTVWGFSSPMCAPSPDSSPDPECGVEKILPPFWHHSSCV